MATYKEVMESNYKAMQENTDPEVQAWINDAGEWASNEKIADVRANMEKYGYEGYIQALSQRHGIDPLLILSIIAVESGGGPPDVKNSFGYTGLMQVAEGRMSLSGDLSLDAETGIDVGCTMFLEKCDAIGSSNPILGIIAYNAGEGMILGAGGSTSKVTNTTGSGWEERDNWLWPHVIKSAVQNAVNFYGQWKYDEVGLYCAKVILAYMKFSGANLTFKNSGIALRVAAGKKGTGVASDDGFSIKPKPHGQHTDSEITKLPKGKTFCEPVYPDLVTVSDKVPKWLLDKANIPLNKMTPDSLVMYSIPDKVLRDACGVDLDVILGNAAAFKERQRVFDPSKYKEEFKQSNPGKPANNNDPFPVDLKIEELETHKPTVKIHTITTCPEAINATKAVLNVSDRAEKRIVKLENMMATMLRYLFRMANRVQINCVYYGGQTPFEKYKGIRCLHDDRISDGQLMSLDQCMNCTRYEPIIGQVYELINSNGANLQAILDDNQMAYMDMKDYVDFTRVERFHEEPATAVIVPETADIRNASEKDFKDMWTKGVEMKWDLVPVEEQKPHLNWRQSINDDGSNMKKLASFPTDEKNFGRQITAKSANGNIMKKNADAMERNSNALLKPPIDQGKTYCGSVTDEFINKMKAGLEKDIKSKLGSNTDIDPLIIAAIMAFENASDASPVVQKYSEVMTSLQIKNPAIVISAYKAEASTFIGDETTNPKIPRIDKVVKPDPEGSSSSSSSSTKPETVSFNLNWEQRESWLWTQFAEPMSINMKNIGAASTAALEFFPSVCYIYLELFKVAKSCRFDGDQFAFPFLEEQLKGVWYTSKYGERWGRFHYGIDLATGPEGKGMEIHAAADGVVASPSGWEDWNSVIIEHADGYYTRYLHNTSICVSPGQTVMKGDVIATVGDTMSEGCYHLHFEIGQGDSVGNKSQYDPSSFFPTLEEKFGDGGSPLADR